MTISAEDVRDIAFDREKGYLTDFARWTLMAKILDGKHAEVFPQDFIAGGGDRPVGFIRRSWRQFSNITGKVPDIQVSPLSYSKTDSDRADLLEKICFAYNDVWGMKKKMRTFAALATGFGACAIGIMPDPFRKYPMFIVEDPRNVLPGGSGFNATRVDRSGSLFVNNAEFPYDVAIDTGGQLSDCIIRKVFTGRQLREMYKGRIPEKTIGNNANDLNHTYVVYIYADELEWIGVLEKDGTELFRAEHGLAWCPMQYYTNYSLGDSPSQSDYEQQIGLEVAFMRILNQKLELNDGVAFPWIKKRGFVNVDPVERSFTLGSPDSDVDTISPPATFQVDRDLGMLMEVLGKMNFETEVSQGEVSGGPITGRGLVELDQIRIATIQAYFDDFASFLPRVYATALMTDRNLFPDVHKSIAGRAGGEPFATSYTPAKDIPTEFGRITTEFGPGFGGFEGHLQMLQSLGAGTISEDTTMRKNPHIRSVTDERRKIWKEGIEKMIKEQALTGQAAVPVEWLAQLVEAVNNQADPIEWIAANPPGQAAATPESVPPVAPGALPPELLGPTGGVGLPGGPGNPTTVYAPALSELMGG